MTKDNKSTLQKIAGFFLGIIVFGVVWNLNIEGLNIKGIHATAIALLTACLVDLYGYAADDTGFISLCSVLCN